MSTIKKILFIIVFIFVCNSCDDNQYFIMNKDYQSTDDTSALTKNIFYTYNVDEHEIMISLHESDKFPNRTTFYELPDVYDKLGFIQTISFVSDGEIFYPDTIKDVFNCPDLGSINGFEYVDTSYVKDFSYSFYACECINDEIISNIKTDSGEDFNHMFYENDALISFDFSKYDFSNANNLESMFAYCTFLENVNFGKSDLSNVTNINNIFCGCTHLKDVDFAYQSFNNVTKMYDMFDSCDEIDYIDISNFKLKSDAQIFIEANKNNYILCNNCKSLHTVILPFSLIKISMTNNLFQNCPFLENVMYREDDNELMSVQYKTERKSE